MSEVVDVVVGWMSRSRVDAEGHNLACRRLLGGFVQLSVRREPPDWTRPLRTESYWRPSCWSPPHQTGSFHSRP